MKKLTLTFFAISIFAGLGYLGFSMSPIGKASLITWLLKRWNKAAGSKDKTLDKVYLKTELKRLSYDDLELLVLYTWKVGVFPETERETPYEQLEAIKKYAPKLHERQILSKADLKQMNNIIFPS